MTVILDRLFPNFPTKEIKSVTDANMAYKELVNFLKFKLFPSIEGNFKRLETYLSSIDKKQTLTATDTISCRTYVVPIEGKGGAVTLTSTPTIIDGFDGERHILMGMSDTNTVKIQDERELTGSNIKFKWQSGPILAAGRNVTIVFNKALGYWYEVETT